MGKKQQGMVIKTSNIFGFLFNFTHPLPLVIENGEERERNANETSNMHGYFLNFTPTSSLCDGKWTRKSEEW